MTSAQSLAAVLPTSKDVAFYQEHGYYVTGKIIPPQILEDALFGVDRFYEGERDYALPLMGGYLDWRSEHGDGLRINDYVSLQNRELQSLLRLPVLAASAARLAGVSTIRLFHDQLIGKPPQHSKRGTAVGWHVDAAYWKTCTSQSMLTAWIPLVDCVSEMGPLTVIDGSHKWTGNDWMTTFTEQDLEKLEDRFKPAGEPPRKVALNLERGQVSFHHARLIHGSVANTSNALRIALTVHFQDGSNRYKLATDAQGNKLVHINDVLCRKDENGNPDYTDPEICPILWQES